MSSGHEHKYAFAVAGTQSGCGKTSITLGLIAALKARGLRIQPFKVGPDFIDPGFHTRLAGVQSRNLDGWMLGRGYNEALFQRLASRADIAVVEGVMGLYDGYDGLSDAGSTAQMAKWLGLPIVLVVDARSMARSAAALVYGFSRFDPEVEIAGVVFNRIGGPEHLAYLDEALSASLPGIPILGGIPRDENLQIPERHLGLVTAEEIHLSPEWIEKTAAMINSRINIDLLLERAPWRQAPLLPDDPRDKSSVAAGSRSGKGRAPSPRKGDASSFPDDSQQSAAVRLAPVTVAVARDAAFCFYYPDNIEMLRHWGAEIRFFSPISGETLPEGTAGVYLGGGYPEVHAQALSRLGENGFFKDIRQAVDRGMPVYAECGGLMALSRFIETLDGVRRPMAGVLPFGTRMLGKRKALGYTEVVLRRPCSLGLPGLRLRGHEFHYSEIVESENDPALELVYELQGRKRKASSLEGYRVGSALASYVHLHWGSAPAAPEAFVERCREWKRKTDEP